MRSIVINSPLFIFLYFITAILFIFSSCKKTKYEQLKRPYNDIESFSVAGYGGLDPIYGVILRDTIFIYWDITVEHPAKVKPGIVVSEGASITPASGEEVNFSDTTTYRVTAEDGSTRQYVLKPVLRQPIPIITSLPATHEWLSTPTFNLTGQYFLSGGDTSVMWAYAQRLSDGFEIELPIVHSKTTSTNITLGRPEYNADLDTGWHRIWLKVGDDVSESKDLFVSQPRANNAGLIVQGGLAEGGNYKAGQELTVNYSFTDIYDGHYARFYNKGNVDNILLYLVNDRGNTQTIAITEFTVTSTQIKFKLPESVSQYAGLQLMQMTVRFPFRYNATTWSTDGPTINLRNVEAYIIE